MNDSCLFCRIAQRDIEADVVAETNDLLAFRDIDPMAPTHVLVIPKRHIASASQLGADDGELLTEIFQMLANIAEKESLGGGHRIVTNVGSDGGQSVDHLHFHLLGGRPMGWPPG
jgi:histidine triad (HIT) family protein